MVIDRTGRIIFVNQAWINFSHNNDYVSQEEWHNINYLDVCDNSARNGEEYGQSAAEGIRKVMANDLDSFYFEYPCHKMDEQRWYMMRVQPFDYKNTIYYVIAHQNITERKQAEEKIFNLCRLDGLTNIPNRRDFNMFINQEWRRCARLNLPISLAIIDIDHFKLINDTYGHQAGDECLIKIGEVLARYANRPGDFCARYGGEEFSLIFSNTQLEQSLAIVTRLLNDIRELKIPNEKSPTGPTVTASIGLAMMYPSPNTDEKDLIKAADNLLYTAKANGKNQVAFQ